MSTLKYLEVVNVFRACNLSAVKAGISYVIQFKKFVLGLIRLVGCRSGFQNFNKIPEPLNKGFPPLPRELVEIRVRSKLSLACALNNYVISQ